MSRSLWFRHSISLPTTSPRPPSGEQSRAPSPQLSEKSDNGPLTQAGWPLLYWTGLLVDQACVAMLCFKLHKVSITVPPSSSTFWYYLPSCLLVDVLVIAVLQTCKHFLSEPAVPSGYEALTQLSYGTSPEPLDRYIHPAKLLAACAMIFLSLVSTWFATVAIGAFEAGDIAVTWRSIFSFKAGGKVEFLLASAMASWWCFAIPLALMISIPFIARLPLLAHASAAASRQNHVGKLLIVLAAVYGVYCTSVRPPGILSTSNMLLDGVETAGEMLWEKVVPPSQDGPINVREGLYGRSNALEPRLSMLKPIQHVFYVSMESADGLAWPWSPRYCEERNCMDMPSEYNNAEHMTPFFSSLINSKDVFYTAEYKANVAYTAKSMFGAMCGQFPEYQGLVGGEIEMNTTLPCLPNLLRVADPSFKSAQFSSQDFGWDHFGDVCNTIGYDLNFGRHDMEADWMSKGQKWLPLTNFFGYSEADVLPYMMEWIDERVASNERIFMNIPGNTCHHNFHVAEHDNFTHIEYTKNSADLNNYNDPLDR